MELLPIVERKIDKISWNIIFSENVKNIDIGKKMEKKIITLRNILLMLTPTLDKNPIIFREKFTLPLDYQNLMPIKFITDGYQGKSITKIPFKSIGPIQYQSVINTLNIFKNNTKICVFATFVTIPNFCVRYQQYNNTYDPTKFTFIYHNYRRQFDRILSKDFEFFIDDPLSNQENKSITTLDIDEPYTNHVIDTTVQTIKNHNVFIIDSYLIDKYRDMELMRSVFSFQTIFSQIVIALHKLKSGGTIIITHPHIFSKRVYSFYVYLSKFFKYNYVHDKPGKTMPMKTLLVFHKYVGGIDLKKLMELNHELYKYDPTGGYKFDSRNNNDNAILKKIFPGIYPELKEKNFKYYCEASNDCSPAEKFLDKMFNVDEALLNHNYGQYQKIIINGINRDIDFFERYYISNSDEDFYKKASKMALIDAIAYCKKINIPLVDWIDNYGSSNDYYHNQIKNIVNITKPLDYDIEYVCERQQIIQSQDVRGINEDYMNNSYQLSENVYSFMDTIDKKKYKQIELVFNFYQKKLEKYLFKFHNINMNGRYVNRAWIKIYELYYTTGYFDNISSENEIIALHICEAPGNFISSSEFYVNKNYIDKKYVWTAQSLTGNVAEIGDEYGFIAENRDNWDFAKHNGDITNYENLKYYYEKYSGVDSLVSDCGIAWSPDLDPKHDITIFQMIYALLIPRVGGNFIIKTYFSNKNPHFISLLYMATCKFKKVKIFKSTRNIWSPEIYIVGISKFKLSDLEINNLFEIANSLTRGEIVYPINRLSEKYVMEYEHINSQITAQYIEIKKLFIYFANDYEFFQSEKKYISEILDKKNGLWIKKFMPFLLPDIKKFYSMK